jgi:transcriptional regulator with XRE-family HTH domain
VNLDRPEPTPTDDEALALGRRLRTLRKQRGLTRTARSAETGLSAAFISQAERGLCRVSIPSLGRLADALGVEAYTLILPERARADRVEITRRRDRPGYVQSDDAPGSSASPLTGAGHQVRAIEVTGGPLQRTGPFRHLNDELLYVIDGSVEVEVDGVVDVLEAGDSLLYSGGVELWLRVLSADARYLVVVVADRMIDGPA